MTELQFSEPMEGDEPLPFDTTYLVHPVADLFPMLAEDELEELAADIKQRGLLQPIVLDAEGRVLDGRNRLAACRIAGVEPDFVKYDGDDPDGYALAANGLRRSQTKTQKAIVCARYLMVKQDQDGLAAKAARELGISTSLVSQARLIVKYALDVAEQILGSPNGSGFADAYELAAERRAEAKRVEADMTRLRIWAPDLLALVEEERIPRAEAIAALDAREAEAQREEEDRQRDERQRLSVEAAALAAAEREELEAISRHKQRLEAVASGWSTMRDYVLGKPGDERTDRILAACGEGTRKAITEIAEQYGGQ